MKILIEKSKAEGRINAPGSKSIAHRVLICASLCQGESHIQGLPMCDDVVATVNCLRNFGVEITEKDGVTIIKGIDLKHAICSKPLDCGESGSTLRFMIPLALLTGEKATLVGSERLMSRPQDAYEKIAEEQGLIFDRKKTSIRLCGVLEAGDYYVEGNVSSQFISGLMLALSTLEWDSRIIITTKLESRSYVEMTRRVMADFGVITEWEDNDRIYIKGGSKYTPRSICIEGDWSGTAFIEAFNRIGGSVEICGLDEGSTQGDKIYSRLFDRLDKGYCEISIEDCPDLAPILFALAAARQGGKFIGTKRLRIKESDRAEAMKQELAKFGAKLLIEDNSVSVLKNELHSPIEALYGHNDHRIVMSLSVLCSLYGGVIDGCEAVSKSYPDFFKDIKYLGIKANEIN